MLPFYHFCFFTNWLLDLNDLATINTASLYKILKVLVLHAMLKLAQSGRHQSRKKRSQVQFPTRGNFLMIFSLHIRSMWETTVMNKQVSGCTVNFGPNFPESPFRRPERPPPPFRKTSDLGWPKFTPEYPPPQEFKNAESYYMWRLYPTRITTRCTIPYVSLYCQQSCFSYFGFAPC